MAFEPINLKTVELNNEEITTIDMGYIPDFLEEEYDLLDPKERNKFIDDVKKLVRGSREYRKYVNYMKRYMDMRKCAYMKNIITEMSSPKVKIHAHHSPITMEEITITVLQKRQFYGEDLSVEMVAKEIMYIHFCLLVGIIPLSETIHTLVHNGYLFIPNSIVFGKYWKFIDMYREWLPEGFEDKMKRIEEYEKVYNYLEEKKILDIHYIYLDFSGAYEFPKLEVLDEYLSNHIKELEQNDYMIPIELFRRLD